MFLLDTMVISEETKRAPHQLAADWLRRTEPASLFLSVATLAEIRRGLGRQKHLNPGFADRLEAWLGRTERRFEDRLLAVDAAVARRWGDLWAQLGFSSPDLIIAATARHHDLIVVTRNLRHFENTGVKLVDPYRRPH